MSFREFSGNRTGKVGQGLTAEKMRECIWVLAGCGITPTMSNAGLCRMAVAGVAIAALNATLFGMISLSFPAREHQLPFH